MVWEPCVFTKPSSHRKEMELPSCRLSPKRFPLTGTPGSGHSLWRNAGKERSMKAVQRRNTKSYFTSLCICILLLASHLSLQNVILPDRLNSTSISPDGQKHHHTMYCIQKPYIKMTEQSCDSIKNVLVVTSVLAWATTNSSALSYIFQPLKVHLWINSICPAKKGRD